MHQIGPSQSVVVAGRALVLQCFATMASIAGQLHSVELLDLVPGQTRANKLAVPANAVVKWTSGRTDALAVSPLASGAGRDVFASPEAPYVLKLQAERWHTGSNAAEVAST